MTIEGVKVLAIQFNITSEDQQGEDKREGEDKSNLTQQDLALKFFHDTGKIICISELILSRPT